MNVQLWFAKDKEQNIITVNEADKQEEYHCPLCGSIVIPKAKSSHKIASHFAHINKNECSGESMIHWWFKHKFIDIGDSFSIKTDSILNYTCSSILTEQTFKLQAGEYRPDLLVTTDCGKEIVFEMANTNKKKAVDYIDRWMELNRIVVEVDIKSLIKEDKVFNALYYQGKCFNINTRDGGYYKTIGKYKESLQYDETFARKLDWFWDDLQKYNNNMLDISDLSISLECISKEDQVKIEKILGCRNCLDFISEHLKFKSITLYEKLKHLNSTTVKINPSHHINSWAGLHHSWWGVDIVKFNGHTKQEIRVQTMQEALNFINGG